MIRRKPKKKGGSGKQKVRKGNWDDHLTERAKKENYPARSVYKLEEIQKKFRVIKKGDRILDLGCSPGSWLLYAAKVAGSQGEVIGLDLKPVTIKIPAHSKAYTGDILNMDDRLDVNVGKDYNLVISDMAPATTGRKDVDALRSLELCQMAFSVAKERLLAGGSFVCKIFQGGDFKGFTEELKTCFQVCKVFKPESCRSQSKEIYIIGTGKK